MSPSLLDIWRERLIDGILSTDFSANTFKNSSFKALFILYDI